MGIRMQKLQKTSSFIIRSSPSFLYLYKPLGFWTEPLLSKCKLLFISVLTLLSFIHSSDPLQECAPKSFSCQGSLRVCNPTPSTVHDFFRPSQIVRSIYWSLKSVRQKGKQQRAFSIDKLNFNSSHFIQILTHLPLQHTKILFFIIISQIPTPHLLKSIHLRILHWWTTHWFRNSYNKL